jgi:FtsP/CotA-like multicopper oxidase with cupredoxin domain
MSQTYNVPVKILQGGQIMEFGNAQILNGSALPTMDAPQGSLYLRHSAGSVSRPYVNRTVAPSGSVWTLLAV